jgi:hypothetical protein
VIEIEVPTAKYLKVVILFNFQENAGLKRDRLQDAKDLDARETEEVSGKILEFQRGFTHFAGDLDLSNKVVQCEGKLKACEMYSLRLRVALRALKRNKNNTSDFVPTMKPSAPTPMEDVADVDQDQDPDGVEAMSNASGDEENENMEDAQQEAFEDEGEGLIQEEEEGEAEIHEENEGEAEFQQENEGETEIQHEDEQAGDEDEFYIITEDVADVNLDGVETLSNPSGGEEEEENTEKVPPENPEDGEGEAEVEVFEEDEEEQEQEYGGGEELNGEDEVEENVELVDLEGGNDELHMAFDAEAEAESGGESVQEQEQHTYVPVTGRVRQLFNVNVVPPSQSQSGGFQLSSQSETENEEPPTPQPIMIMPPNNAPAAPKIYGSHIFSDSEQTTVVRNQSAANQAQNGVSTSRMSTRKTNPPPVPGFMLPKQGPTKKPVLNPGYKRSSFTLASTRSKILDASSQSDTDGGGLPTRTLRPKREAKGKAKPVKTKKPEPLRTLFSNSESEVEVIKKIEKDRKILGGSRKRASAGGKKADIGAKKARKTGRQSSVEPLPSPGMAPNQSFQQQGLGNGFPPGPGGNPYFMMPGMNPGFQNQGIPPNFQQEMPQNFQGMGNNFQAGPGMSPFMMNGGFQPGLVPGMNMNNGFPPMMNPYYQQQAMNPAAFQNPGMGMGPNFYHPNFQQQGFGMVPNFKQQQQAER